MERLTRRVCGGFGLAPGYELNTVKGMKAVVDRLAAYEDTMTIERVKELAQAEKDGRLVVLPSKDYCWRIRGDIFLDIIRANCRAAHEEADAALKKREEADYEQG